MRAAQRAATSLFVTNVSKVLKQCQVWSLMLSKHFRESSVCRCRNGVSEMESHCPRCRKSWRRVCTPIPLTLLAPQSSHRGCAAASGPSLASGPAAGPRPQPQPKATRGSGVLPQNQLPPLVGISYWGNCFSQGRWAGNTPPPDRGDGRSGWESEKGLEPLAPRPQALLKTNFLPCFIFCRSISPRQKDSSPGEGIS